MIQVFCNKRGSGKTKKLIDLANGQLFKLRGILFPLMMIPVTLGRWTED